MNLNGVYTDSDKDLWVLKDFRCLLIRGVDGSLIKRFSKGCREISKEDQDDVVKRWVLAYSVPIEFLTTEGWAPDGT